MLSEDKEKKFIHPLVLLILSLVGYANFEYSVHRASNSTLVEQFFFEFLSPIQLGFRNVLDIGDHVIERYFKVLDVKERNEFLEKRNKSLKILIRELEYQRGENIRLESLLNFSENIETKKVLARVISLGNSGKFLSFKVNKGINEGVKKNDVVINSDGLVGVVAFASNNYSEILTVLDFASRVDVLASRSRVHGILRGHQNSTCLMRFVKKNEDVKIGDELQTSGMGAVYPKGIHVGTVIDLKFQESDLTKRIVVKPSVNFSKLEEVVILTEEQEKIKFEN